MIVLSYTWTPIGLCECFAEPALELLATLYRSGRWAQRKRIIAQLLNVEFHATSFSLLTIETKPSTGGMFQWITLNDWFI